jgi:hypothetical protein
MTEHLTATRAGERFGVAIAAATDCHQACIEALSWGLQRRGESAHLLHARLLLDFAHQVAALTADVCERCAASCERMGDGMAASAAACRTCAAACRALR